MSGSLSEQICTVKSDQCDYELCSRKIVTLTTNYNKTIIKLKFDLIPSQSDQRLKLKKIACVLNKTRA